MNRFSLQLIADVYKSSALEINQSMSIGMGLEMG
jgi:hypothetical protein